MKILKKAHKKRRGIKNKSYQKKIQKQKGKYKKLNQILKKEFMMPEVQLKKEKKMQ